MKKHDKVKVLKYLPSACLGPSSCLVAKHYENKQNILKVEIWIKIMWNLEIKNILHVQATFILIMVLNKMEICKVWEMGWLEKWTSNYYFSITHVTWSNNHVTENEPNVITSGQYLNGCLRRKRKSKTANEEESRIDFMNWFYGTFKNSGHELKMRILPTETNVRNIKIYPTSEMEVSKYDTINDLIFQQI